MTTVFRHGALRLYLLKLLGESPRHGYEVISLLEDRFLGLYAPSAGTVYPRLARLEAEGLVQHEQQEGRKVYSLTDAGRAELERQAEALSTLEADLSKSVAAMAQDVREQVRASVRDLRAELKQAARDVRREVRSEVRRAGSAGLRPVELTVELERLRADLLARAAQADDAVVDRVVTLVRKLRKEALAVLADGDATG
ncbi:MAG: PadR family transcriptional regulator [Frankiales bacterium]|nr:PadR family transcriptional regulator [Frankiales bacterium]